MTDDSLPTPISSFVEAGARALAALGGGDPDRIVAGNVHDWSAKPRMVLGKGFYSPGQLTQQPLWKFFIAQARAVLKSTGRIDVDSGIGRTSKQIREAPIGALYIWPNKDCGSLSYVGRLATYLGRTDLRVRPVDHLAVSQWWRGYAVGIVIDHAALELMGSRHWRAYFEILSLSHTRADNTVSGKDGADSEA
jgi:hypothetical protein